MISIEEYIAQRKKEDKINEFDKNACIKNIKICIDYIFEYFSNYLNMTELINYDILNSRIT